ncbi:MAG TPA: hypothetical protein VLQ67_03005 [Arachnia sp.]|nr:hypothetical protein [Arachnia sp.]
MFFATMRDMYYAERHVLSPLPKLLPKDAETEANATAAAGGGA